MEALASVLPTQNRGICRQTLINLKTAYKKTNIDIQIQFQYIILNWFWLLIEKGESLLEKINHPFITMDNQIRGQHPVISGTGIRVIDIVIEYEYKGYSIDQIIDYHPQLQLQQIHAALSYYYVHQAEIDSQIKAEREQAEKLKKQLLQNVHRIESNYA